MKSEFLDKLIARIDQVEPGEVHSLVMRLAREKELLEDVFEALKEGVIILDPENRILFANRAAAQFFGLIPAKCIGHTLNQTVRGLDWKSLMNPKQIVTRDMEVLYPEKRLLNFYISPIHSEHSEESNKEGNDEIFGYALIVRDITQSRQQEEENMETEKLNALTLLAAGVAHEIGNPLNSLNIHLQLLERKIKKLPIDAQASLSDHLQTAQGEIRRLDTILKQFLQAIRPTQPNSSEYEPAQLHDLLKDTLTVLAPELEERKVKIALDLANNTPPLNLDTNQIKQALYNLLKNAFQALPASGGLIEISSRVTDYEVTLTIRDHGSGIPPEMMGALFEPFRSTKKSGNGLGLLIVRRIVREHGGELEIESEQGKGTSVTLSFPRQHKNVRLLQDHTTNPLIEIAPTND